MSKEMRKQADQIYNDLDKDYKTWEPHYKELAEHLNPRRQRFNKEDTGRESYVNKKIVDPTATLSMRTAMGGMYSGITNPTTKWISFKVADEELNKYHAVRKYFNDCALAVQNALAKSNFYNVVPSVFLDILCYSTASVSIEKSDQFVVRFYPNPMGSYRIANGFDLKINTHATRRMWTTEQIVSRFGLDNVSRGIKHEYEQGHYQNRHEVRHLAFDNPDFIPSAFNAVNKKVCSVWWEPAAEDNKILRRSGYDEFPFLTPRWEALGIDSYGSFGSGMLALGSIKGLQLDQMNKHKAGSLKLLPPMIGPSSLQNKGTNFMPGGMTFVDVQQGMQGLVPAFQTDFSTSEALLSIDDTRKIIDQAFFKDLFLAVLNVDKSGVTAYEIAQRKEEKLIMLGPVLSRFNEEFLDPTVMFTFKELNRRGMLPPMPPELEGREVEIEYMGTLQQAQKAVGINSIERTLGFYGNLAGLFPQVLDNINIDAVASIYQDITGTTPRIMNDERTRDGIREQRAGDQQRQQLLEMAPAAQQGAHAAELLSKVDMRQPSGLTNILGGGN